MGYDPTTGLWLGYCPHAAWIDRDSCCLSLNIVPIVYGFVFLCFVVGCSSYGWVTFYLISGPTAFGYILFVAIIDSEPCLAIGLTLQAIIIAMALTALARRCRLRLHRRRAGAAEAGVDAVDDLSPVEAYAADIANVQLALTPRGGSSPTGLRGAAAVVNGILGGGGARTPRGGSQTPRGGSWTDRTGAESARDWDLRGVPLPSHRAGLELQHSARQWDGGPGGPPSPFGAQPVGPHAMAHQQQMQMQMMQQQMMQQQMMQLETQRQLAGYHHQAQMAALQHQQPQQQYHERGMGQLSARAMVSVRAVQQRQQQRQQDDAAGGAAQPTMLPDQYAQHPRDLQLQQPGLVAAAGAGGMLPPPASSIAEADELMATWLEYAATVPGSHEQASPQSSTPGKPQLGKGGGGKPGDDVRV
jgi:hypothetical protein